MTNSPDWFTYVKRSEQHDMHRSVLNYAAGGGDYNARCDVYFWPSQGPKKFGYEFFNP